MPWCWGFHGAWRFDAKTERQAYGERVQAQRTKSRKDAAQAAALLDYLSVNDTAAIAAMNGLYPECDFVAKMAQATE